MHLNQLKFVNISLKIIVIIITITWLICLICSNVRGEY